MEHHHPFRYHTIRCISFDGYAGHPDELISLLQLLQKQDGYISKEGVRQIASFLEIVRKPDFQRCFILFPISLRKTGEK